MRGVGSNGFVLGTGHGSPVHTGRPFALADQVERLGLPELELFRQVLEPFVDLVKDRFVDAEAFSPGTPGREANRLPR